MHTRELWLTRWLDRSQIIFIALIPLFYLILDPYFGQNQAGDVDTWFYYGLAKSFWHPLGTDFINDYYETRLPYIIPAAVAFSIPNDRLASFIFSYLVYSASAFSLFYVLRVNVSKAAALLATTLMTMDIFYMRTVGWQYVDNGVVAYSSLALATLTQATRTRHKLLPTFLSGFFIASMLMIHLGSMPLALALFAYALATFDLNAMQWKSFVKLLLAGAAGALTCQAIYGFLNMALYGTSFLFELQQITAGLTSEQYSGLFEPTDLLFEQGWWLVLDVAVWIAASAAVLTSVTGYFKPSKFQAFCMLSVFIIYPSLFMLDYFHVTYFLGRSGLYASFFIPLSYLFLGSIMPRTMRTSTVLMIALLFACSLSLRMTVGDEFRGFWHATALVIGVLLGVVIIALNTTRYKIVSFIAFPLAACLSLTITWSFSDQTEVYQARRAITAAAGGSLPYLLFSKQDPDFYPLLVGIAGSFTWRAWRSMCDSFPDCWRHSIGQRYAFVMARDPDVEGVRNAALSTMAGVKFKNGNLIYRSKSNLFVYRFDLSRTSVIPAQSLNSQVGSSDNGARIAVQGTPAGALTYGPYAILQPGRYEIVTHYKSSGATGTWDVVADGDIKARGSIPDSRDQAAEIDSFIDLPRGAQVFEARTFYSGHGHLTVSDVSIRLIADQP